MATGDKQPIDLSLAIEAARKLAESEQGQDHVLGKMAAGRANVEPLPGSLSHAFGPSAIDVSGISVRKVTGADWEIWHILKSHVLELFKELEKPVEQMDEVKSSPLQDMQLIYQFTRPCKEVYALACKGKDAFDAAVMESIGFDDEFTSHSQALLFAIMEQIQRHQLTKLKFIGELKEGGEVSFLSNPPAQPKTASAG